MVHLTICLRFAYLQVRQILGKSLGIFAPALGRKNTVFYQRSSAPSQQPHATYYDAPIAPPPWPSSAALGHTTSDFSPSASCCALPLAFWLADQHVIATTVVNVRWGDPNDTHRSITTCIESAVWPLTSGKWRIPAIFAEAPNMAPSIGRHTSPPGKDAPRISRP